MKLFSAFRKLPLVTMAILIACCGSGWAAGASGMSTFQANLVAVSGGTCVDVPGAVPTSGLVLAQKGCIAPLEQTFAFLVQTDGTYILTSPASVNLCVDINDSGLLVQNYCLPTASQKWGTTTNPDGSYTLVNQQNSQCLIATAASPGIAAAFTTATCTPTTAQEFSFAAVQPYTPAPVPLLRPAAIAPIPNPTAGQFQAGMFNGLPYRILFPAGYNPTLYTYPITLYLHGAGESGTDNLRQLLNDVHALPTDMDFRAKVPMILVAPQCPTTDNWGNAFSATPTPTEALTAQLMQALVSSSIGVDSTRVSVTGLSMGGIGTWDMINRYPVLFAAAAPIAGAGNIADVPNLVKVPILAVHGSADTVIYPVFDEAMYASIHAKNGPMIYYELSGFGHDVWDFTYPLTAFWQWISTQKHI